MNTLDVQIEPKRKEILKEEFEKPYFLEIKKILEKEKSAPKRRFSLFYKIIYFVIYLTKNYQ